MRPAVILRPSGGDSGFATPCARLPARSKWNRQRHAGPFARGARDEKLAPQEEGALAHGQEPEGFRIGDLPVSDPPAVILHGQEEAIRLLLQADGDVGGPGMARDIAQGLLEDAEHRRAPLSIQIESLETRLELTLNARSRLKPPRLP